jgi:hypothetical protein
MWKEEAVAYYAKIYLKELRATNIPYQEDR